MIGEEWNTHDLRVLCLLDTYEFPRMTEITEEMELNGVE